MTHFDADWWWEMLGKPDWYRLVYDDFKQIESAAQAETDYGQRKDIKRPMYETVEKAYAAGHIPLADHGQDQDAERQPIDTIVIHHTKNPPGMTLDRLNAMHLLRIYGIPQHARQEPTNNKSEQLVWSGHYYQNKQVFWGYHWLVRADGSTEHILNDKYIGWHAGDWPINCRSIAICFDDDLSNKLPSKHALAEAAGIIRKYYPHVEADRIIGHRDANPTTACPGDKFHALWRNELLQQIA
jgi:N-acetyl-anhydromuramyl-L-alanine amidase AmpD